MPPRCSCSAIPSSAITSSLWQTSIQAAGRGGLLAPAHHIQLNAPAAAAAATAAFSTTASREYNSKTRREFWHWLSKGGLKFKKHSGEGPQYVSRQAGRVFPQNEHFYSRPVLADSARELIWKKVIKQGETIKAVSAELGVDINRVAAVVRLKEVERDWEAKVRLLACITPPLHLGNLYPPLYDDCFKKIRLVLKTHTWLQTCCEPL